MGFQPSGVKEFIKLDDTPGSYAGQAGKFTRVNTGETALEMAAAIAGVKVRKNYQMPVIGTRPQLNLVEGAAIDLSIQDNPPDDEIDIVIGSKVPTRYMTLFPDDAILPVANPPAKATVDGANFSYDVLDFDQNTEEKCYWERWLTPDYDAENIVVDIHWIATPGAGDVKWGLSTLGREEGEAWDSALGTEQTVVSPTGGAGVVNKARIATFSPNWAGKDVVMFKVARKAADGLDTLAADARVLKVVVQYTGQFAQSFYPLAATLLTKPASGAWGDVDVKSYVPAGATGVILKIVNDTAGGVLYGLRKKGSTDDRRSMVEAITFGGIVWAYIGIDENRKFQIWYSVDGDFKVYLVAYTGTGVVFFDNGYDKTIAPLSSWTDVDCSDICPSDAIAAILEIENSHTSQATLGHRKKGSTDDRTSDTDRNRIGDRGKTWYIVGLDGSQVYQQYKSIDEVETWVVGYITQGVVMKTNADEANTTPTFQWNEVDLASECPSGIMIFMEMGQYSAEYRSGIRKKGDTVDEDNRGKHGTNVAVVACDSMQRIENYHGMADPSTTFWVVGYAQWAGA